jgi:hypothetical protein
MKTDKRGGAPAGSNLEERLADRFAAELKRAEGDYSSLRLLTRATGKRTPAGPSHRLWPRLVGVPVGAVVVAIVVIALSPLLLPASPPIAPGPAASGVVMGSDGLPATIDGQRVYRVAVYWTAGNTSWPTSGSFLLGAFPVSYTPSCPGRLPGEATLAPEDATLVGSCQDASFPAIGLEADSAADPMSSPPLVPAPKGADALTEWLGGPGVVVRVHTHDSAAAQCTADQRDACESALVVEAVVWPVVPAQLNGERVYRAVDRASFPTTGSFLLGGLVTMPDLIPPCPMQIGITNAEQQLIPYCYWAAVDGIEVAPMGADMSNLHYHSVVARVHIHDQLAAQCPESALASCQASVVVESIAWDSGPVNLPPSASPNPVPTSSAPLPTEGSTVSLPVPPPSVVVGPDEIPTSLGDQTVYRAANLPTNLSSFYLGGKLTRDQSCPAPTAPLAKPPACGYWMVDGVRVGTQIALDEGLVGQPVVAAIQVSRAMAICPGGSCTQEILVVTAIVWPDSVASPPVLPAQPS